ncbi:MAG: amidophosphoribosyltransferase [Dehalococcoidia bacterium]|nr:amidophosphoribosyltransferase [Dehalococcoidia bacterium]
MRESCGIFGIFAPGEDIARLTYFALFALQHRGQESAGIATSDGQKLQVFAKMGLVSQVFTEDDLAKLSGFIAIGHNRYSTTGASQICNVQPLMIGSGEDALAIAYNGNITNSTALHKELQEKGYSFNTTSDSEIIANLILSSTEKEFTAKIRYAMRRLQGAYSLVLLTKEALWGVRDSLGMRPFCVGNLNGHGWVLASETCALDNIGASFLREVAPGEIIRIDKNGLCEYPEPSDKHALCIFEYIYFARPDSIISNRLIYDAREAMGARLAEEHPVVADLVVGVPDSATPAAVGYSHASGIPLGMGLIKNRYMGRTFIEPEQRLRDLGVKLKFNPMRPLLEGKRVVLVDDSIVRGTTTPQVIKLLRGAGAKEVHMRICAPPICHPCFMGVDMATRRELIAAQKTLPEIRETIGADSLGYLSLEGLIKAIGLPKDQFCLACFTGHYPLPVQLEMGKFSMEYTEEPSSSTADNLAG